MLTREENETLTRVGPGTPCGELMRRYWHPIAATVQLEDNPVRKVRILGEDLVLFQDCSGNLGLIGPRCPHRAMHMAFGIPEEAGLRCPYHGWLFDGTGQCLSNRWRRRTALLRTGCGPPPTRCKRWVASSGPIWGRSPCPSCPGWASASGTTSCGRLSGICCLDYVLGQDMVAWYEQGEITDRTQEHLYEGDKVIIAYRQMLKEQIEIVQQGGDPMNVMRDPAENVPWTPTLEGWPAATIEAATRTGLPWRQRTTSYRFNFHKVSKGGWKYIEDDVDRYCPDRELILKLYEEADRVMQQQAPARQ